MDWYLLIYYLSDGNIELGTQWKLVVTIGYATMGIIGIPIVVWITGKMSKIHGLMFVYTMMIINSILRWFVYRPGRFDTALSWGSFSEIGTSLTEVLKSLIWLDPMTGGIFWIGVGVLMQSMIADVCDDDELKNGRRREGMFGAVFGWATKASFAFSFVLIGVFLNAIGFNPSAGSQTVQTYTNMRIAMCFGAGLPALFCFIMLKFYPITKKKAEENRKKLEDIRGAV
jgi:GPH family glycoside/pentoside/hexuronide:cation symporter